MSLSGKIYFLLFLATIIIKGCSPEAGRKTLNFFFDGVSNNEALLQTIHVDTLNVTDTSIVAIIVPSVPQTIYHIPYLEKECAACHDRTSMGKLVMSQPRLCYQCHENFGEKYNVLHGPVAGGYCSDCHHPHFAKEKNLLKRTGQDLCLNCHVSGEGFNTTIHEGIEDTNCTECHNPHGGEDRLMFN